MGKRRERWMQLTEVNAEPSRAAPSHAPGHRYTSVPGSVNQCVACDHRRGSGAPGCLPHGRGLIYFHSIRPCQAV